MAEETKTIKLLKDLVTKNEERCNNLLKNPQVAAACEKWEKGAILNEEEEKFYGVYNAALGKLTDAQSDLDQQRSAQTSAASGKRPRETLSYYKCTFTKDGKENKSFLGQKETLDELYEKLLDVEEAAKELTEAAPDERSAKAQKVEETIVEGKKAFQKRAEDLVIAYDHGWDVVRGLKGAVYAETDEEQKHLDKTIRAVSSKKKKETEERDKRKPRPRPVGPQMGAGYGGGQQHTALRQQPLGGAATPHGRGAGGVNQTGQGCYKCGQLGHFAANCTAK